MQSSSTPIAGHMGMALFVLGPMLDFLIPIEQGTEEANCGIHGLQSLME